MYSSIWAVLSNSHLAHNLSNPSAVLNSWDFRFITKKSVELLVGGWTNPSEQYSSNWIISRRIGVKIKVFETITPICTYTWNPGMTRLFWLGISALFWEGWPSTDRGHGLEDESPIGSGHLLESRFHRRELRAAANRTELATGRHVTFGDHPVRTVNLQGQKRNVVLGGSSQLVSS